MILPFSSLVPICSWNQRVYVGEVVWAGFQGDSKMLQLADTQEQRSHWKAPKGCRAWPEHGKVLGEEASSQQ